MLRQSTLHRWQNRRPLKPRGLLDPGIAANVAVVAFRWDPYPFILLNLLALQYLIVWYRDAHGDDCGCVRQAEPVVRAMLATLAATVDPRSRPTAGEAGCCTSPRWKG